MGAFCSSQIHNASHQMATLRTECLSHAIDSSRLLRPCSVACCLEVHANILTRKRPFETCLHALRGLKGVRMEESIEISPNCHHAIARSRHTKRIVSLTARELAPPLLSFELSRVARLGEPYRPLTSRPIRNRTCEPPRYPRLPANQTIMRVDND